MISKVTLDLINEENKNKTIIVAKAPPSAENIVIAGNHSAAKWKVAPPLLSMKRATPKEAPDEIPNTDGPARGL